ncbi:hypothetical protein Q5752_006719 [Cryptotrichosporon argae]
MSNASNTSSGPVYTGANIDVEKGRGHRIERVITPGGHPADFSQPAIPPQHRKYGNPVPLGLVSFGCGFFLASASVRRDHPVFGSYGAFNLTYGALYLPAFGVITAYTEADGSISPEFNQAIGLYLMAWMMVTILFIIGALRSSGGVLGMLSFAALAFIALGIFNFTGHDGGRIAGGVFGMCATATAWWTAMCGYFTPDRRTAGSASTRST